jgi:hypothetical protein
MHEMATEPFRKLLDRDLAKVAAKPLIDLASPLLIEVVNNATMAFQRCHVSIGRGGDSEMEKDEGQHLAPFILYQHMIEMTDGIEVLISNCCCGPTLPLLRSMLEAFLSLDYMFKEDYKRSSLAWFCSYVHKQIKTYELLDPTTQQGKEVKKTLERAGDPNVTGYFSSETVQKLQRALTSELSTIENEYKRQKKLQKRTPQWYSLFDGPRNLHDLAAKVSKLGYYMRLYPYWSSVVHGTDASQYLAEPREGKLGFHQIRYPAYLKDYAWFAATFLAQATFMMIRKFRPDEDFSRWHAEVQERLNYLWNLKVEMEPIKT